MSNYSTLIIALKGCDDIETDGFIIHLEKDADMDVIRTLASEKLGLVVPLDEIIFETSGGEILNDIDSIKSKQVVYATCKEQFKEISRVPRFPFVGNLYSMVPDL